MHSCIDQQSIFKQEFNNSNLFLTGNPKTNRFISNSFSNLLTGYSKEPSFEHPKSRMKLKKNIFYAKNIFNQYLDHKYT